MKYAVSSAGEIGRQQDKLRTWLESGAGQSAAAGNRDQVEMNADKRGQSEFLNMSSSLKLLAVFPLATGVSRILLNQPEGWSNCRDAAQMLVLWWRGLRARANKERLALAGANIGFSYYSFAHASLLSMAIADRATADWCAEAALAMTVDGIAARSCLPADKTFHEWVASVSAAWLGQSAPARSSQSDPEIFALINERRDDSAVEKLLPVLLDYHLWRSDERQKSRNPDVSYVQPGLALLPTVALAIAALRRKEGIPDLPHIEHPLAALATWNPPSSAEPSDPLINVVTRRTLRMESGEY